MLAIRNALGADAGHGIAGGQVGIENGGALTSYSQRQSIVFGGSGQIAINVQHIRMAARE